MQSVLDRIVIVLVQPEDGANVGSVCRAMKNMGVYRLTIVGEKELDTERVQTLALHAMDIYRRTSFVSSVEEALKGTVFSAGVTRRRGRFRKYVSLLPEELAERCASITEGDIALVFGNEDYGLTDKELSPCNIAVHIPSSPDFPSLNLSHAVHIITYSLFCRETKPTGFSPITRGDLDLIVGKLLINLEKIGFFTQAGKEDMVIFFTDIFARAALSREEAQRMVKIFNKIEGLKNKRV
ncbi:MAG: TrmH family RNA methyltransferase [Spirochaetota bacterium]